MSHEADVVMIEAAEAARARVQRNDPRVNQAAVVIEANSIAPMCGSGLGASSSGW